MEARRLAVLGAAGGIGRALVARAVLDGWEVIALDLPASLSAHPPPVEAREVDVTDPASVAAAFDGLGPLGGFVNLAGFMTPLAPLSDVSVGTFDEAITGNLRGAFLACQTAAPLLRARGGAMVNIVSGLAAFTRPVFGPYAAAKAGMVSLTKTLALELSPDVRVNAVGPSALDTAFLRGGEGRAEADKVPMDFDAMAAATPLKRMASPDDVVGPTMFLLGPDAAFMTGQVLWLNGGSYMP